MSNSNIMRVRKFLLILLLSNVMFVQSVTVNTESGPVIGSEEYYNGKKVEKYLGIPYAEPPVGELRFKKTVPVKPWTNPLPALVFPPSCMQIYPFNYPWVDQMPGKDENCLYLNIWVPKNDTSNSPKAVMFWIFSGGFSAGSNRLPVYDGHVLAAEGDVIVVTINYRLGIFGFLSTGCQDSPGNMGLFDVLEALKWTNKNIGEFGGNPKSITVFGQSAGSLASSFLIFSPLSRGLFQRAIMESGAPSPMHRDTMELNLQLGQKVAEAVDCASKYPSIEKQPCEVVRCLRKQNAALLTKTVSSIVKTSVTSFLQIYGDDYLPMSPYAALEKGSFQDVDLMIGIVKNEGSFLITAKYPEIFGPYGEKNPKINKTLGRELINQTLPNGDEISDHYFRDLSEDDYDNIRSQVCHARGAFGLVCPSLYFAMTYSDKGNNVYSYYYNHRSANTVFASWMGVTHFSEVPFVFGRPLDNPSEYSEEEINFSKQLLEMWTNFAKYGYPSSSWSKCSSPYYYTQFLQMDNNYDNYFYNHTSNCAFFRKYLFN